MKINVNVEWQEGPDDTTADAVLVLLERFSQSVVELDQCADVQTEVRYQP